METSDFLSQVPPDRILFVCWLPRADLLDLGDGDYLQVSRIDDLYSSRRHPLADLVRWTSLEDHRLKAHEQMLDDYEEEDP